MNDEKLSRMAHIAVIAVCGGAAIYLFFRYLFLLLLPFLIAWGIAEILCPVARYLHEKCGIHERFCRVMLSVLAIVLVVGLFSLLAARLIGEGVRLLSDAAGGEGVASVLSFLLHPLSGLLGGGEASADLEAGITEALHGVYSTLLSGLAGGLARVAGAVPRGILFLFATVIACVYFAWDLETINRTVVGLLPRKAGKRLARIKRGALVTAGKYVGSYLVLMAITFSVMTIGFVILDVRYAMLVALVVALLDALPVIGVGTVLIPWSLYELTIGQNVGLAVGLAVLYLVNELLRQFIEPRLIGKNLGIHPLVSLIFLYVGYALFGILGLLFIPLAIALLQIARRERQGEIQTK